MTAVTNAALSLLEQKDERERPYDMVLADVHMPVMDGFELLRRVNGEFNLPVVRKCLCIVFTINCFLTESLHCFLISCYLCFIFLRIE